MERRQHRRKHISVELDIHSRVGSCSGRVCNMSLHDMFLTLDSGIAPGEDEQLTIAFSIHTGRHLFSRQASGTVVRASDEGVAIRFTQRDLMTRGVIEEVMYYVDLAAQCEKAA